MQGNVGLFVAWLYQIVIFAPAGDFESAHTCRLSAPCLPADRPTYREGGPT